MSNKGYEPIPDVEQGLGSNEIKLSAQERYPEANEKETELLLLLDQCIEDTDIGVVLPKVSAEDFGKPESNFCFSLVLSTLVFLGILAGIIFLPKTDPQPQIWATLRYAAVFLLYLTSIKPISFRMKSQALKSMQLAENTQEATNLAVDNVAVHVHKKVDEVEDNLHAIVDPVRPKLKEATKSEKALKKLDPNFNIPNPADIEKELDAITENFSHLADNIKEVKKSISTNQFIPESLKSLDKYRRQVFFPTLLACFVLQMAGAFSMICLFPSTGGETIMEGWNSLQRLMDTATFEVTPFSLVVFEVYAMAILQIAVVFFVTRPSAMISSVNEVRTQATAHVNQMLVEKGTYFLCNDTLETRMGRIKQKVLVFIVSLKKTEKLMEQVSQGPSERLSVSTTDDRHPIQQLGDNITKWLSPKNSS